MPSPKKFASYANKLSIALAFIDSGKTNKAITVLKKLMENAEKAAGTGKASGPKPKRPLNNYMLFSMENREVAKENLGEGAKQTEIAKELGRMWAEVKDSWKPSGRRTSVKSLKSSKSSSSKSSSVKAKKPKASPKAKAAPKAKKAKATPKPKATPKAKKA